MRDTVIINGREAVILYRHSRSTQKEEPRLNTLETLRVIEELLRGDRSRIYDRGITTLATLSALDGLRMNDTRISNKIVELRKVIPKNGILTFKYLDEKIWRYGLIKDDDILAYAEDLKTTIQNELEKVH